MKIRRTKILVTLGPSTDPPGILRRLLDAGVDVVRLNMSHGTHADHLRRLRAVRRGAAAVGRHIPVLADLSGPKIRVGELPEAGLELVGGTPVRLVPGAGPVPSPRGRGAPTTIPVPVPGLLSQARKGSRFLLKDGLIRLRARRVRSDEVLCEVEEGGLLRSHQGIALPGARLPLPALTAKDRRDLRFGVEAGVDVFALSFVRAVADVRQAMRLAGEIPVVAKIERPEALDVLSPIIEACAGVMVARGDLGVELGAERVPLLQKEILRESNRRGRIAILATQMLASMEQSPVPTRAEATDVANAVLDGADGLLLTGETAGGRHPVEAVSVLDRIVREVESSVLYRGMSAPPLTVEGCPEEALAAAGVDAARNLEIAALVVLSRTGRTTGLLSDHRPQTPIVALAATAAQARLLALEWGVVPTVRGRRAGRDIRAAVRIARRTLGVRAEAWYCVLHGAPGGEARHLSLVRG